MWAHGFLLVGGEKMSKTKLTGIHPFELIDHFGVDAYRYYFMREIQFGGDGNFSWESMVERYNADLANDFGNLASRVLAMTASYFEGAVPPRPAEPGPEARLAETAARVAAAMDEDVRAMRITESLTTAWDLIKDANRWLVEVEPRGRWPRTRTGGRSWSAPSTRAWRCCGSWRSCCSRSCRPRRARCGRRWGCPGRSRTSD